MSLFPKSKRYTSSAPGIAVRRLVICALNKPWALMPVSSCSSWPICRACYGALGLGASGLTFYDDDVTAFFTPHATGKSAIFVVALGQTARENRVRPFRSRVGMRLDALSRRDC